MQKCIKGSFPLISTKGEYSHEIETGKLTIPRRVHANGTHITYNVTHFSEYDNGLDDDDTDHPYHYHIDLHDETVHVELR